MSREARPIGRHLTICLLLCTVLIVQLPCLAARLKSASAEKHGAIPPEPPAGVLTTGAHPGPLASPRLSVDSDYRLSPGDVVRA